MRPNSDDPPEPESPTDLTRPSMRDAIRMTAQKFSGDRCLDLAAALTYFSVLSLFPALVMLVSLLGVFGKGQHTTDAVLRIVDKLGPPSAVDTLREPIEAFTRERAVWDSAQFAAAVEAQEERRAGALLNGALADGMHLADLEASLAEAALAHYNDFGHTLIYLMHVRNLVERLGPEVEQPLVPRQLAGSECGKAPLLVLDDADLDQAVNAAAFGASTRPAAPGCR